LGPVKGPKYLLKWEETVMEIIKCMAEDIEATMDLAEDNIK